MNADQLAQMNADELRAFTMQLMTEISDVRRDNTWKQLKIDQLTHEMALMKRRKFGAGSEQLKGERRHLFEETVEADLEAMALELKALQRAEAQAAPKETPKRAPLLASRIEELLPHRWSVAWRLRTDSARWVRRTVTLCREVRGAD